MNICDVVDLSYESPDDDCEIIGDTKCSNLTLLNIDMQLEDIIPELAELIKHCLNKEYSTGMVRVIKRSLLRAYDEASHIYIKSTEFKKLVNNTLYLINAKPNYKFSHIKALCENLKLNKKKKRAELINLGSCIKRNTQCLNSGTNKKKKIEIINLDEIEDEEGPEQIDDDDVIPCNISMDINEEKENECINNNLPTKIADVPILNDVEIHGQHIEPKGPPKHPYNLPQESSSNNIPIEIKCDVKIAEDEQMVEEKNLLVVQRIEQADNDNVVQLKIIQIEAEIASLNVKIQELDEQEVNDNSHNSPYVQSESLKNKVVTLYKELCTLTNSQPVKRHEIKIKVAEGHSEGPASILENLLNRNLKSNGYPPFPTFNEVKNCVLVANQKYNLGWRPIKIFQEASMLFTQCGRALQKLRQQREWGHLLARVKHEHCDDDPADHDKELKARLDANKEIAKRKENDIIDRYAALEKEMGKGQNDNVQCVQSENGTSQNNHLEVDNSSESDSESELIWDDDSILQSDFQPIPIKIENESKTDNVIVKEENEGNNEDITKLLHQLGDDYTTKIIDIEDPFLVVEISDSSDEENL